MGASVTSDLTSDPALVRAGINANEICYPQVTVSGLGDYDRKSGYVDGTVDVTWVTTQFNYDRGTKIQVDTMDNQETANIAFGRAGSELQRTKVAPEADAFTFATLAGKTGISTADADLADGNAVLQALVIAKTKMDEDEVPEEGRILYITPTNLNAVEAVDSYKSREVLKSFAKVQKVPQSRFYTSIDLLDGKSTGEELGHYKKSTDALDINFMIVEKSAVIKHDKHIASNIIPASANQSSDKDMLKYRKYGLVDVYNNKTAGIYVHTKKKPASGE